MDFQSLEARIEAGTVGLDVTDRHHQSNMPVALRQGYGSWEGGSVGLRQGSGREGNFMKRVFGVGNWLERDRDGGVHIVLGVKVGA